MACVSPSEALQNLQFVGGLSSKKWEARQNPHTSSHSPKPKDLSELRSNASTFTPGCALSHAATVFMESPRPNPLQDSSATKSASNSKSSATSASSLSSALPPTVYDNSFGSILNNFIRFRTSQHANGDERFSGIKCIAPGFF